MEQPKRIPPDVVVREDLRNPNPVVRETKLSLKKGGEIDPETSALRLGMDEVQISISESIKRFEKNPGEYRHWKQWRYEATGNLSLEIDGYGDGLRKKWADGKVQRLENILGSFILTLHDWMEFQKTEDWIANAKIDKKQEPTKDASRLNKRNNLKKNAARSCIVSWMHGIRRNQ